MPGRTWYAWSTQSPSFFSVPDILLMPTWIYNESRHRKRNLLVSYGLYLFSSRCLYCKVHKVTRHCTDSRTPTSPRCTRGHYHTSLSSSRLRMSSQPSVGTSHKIFVSSEGLPYTITRALKNPHDQHRTAWHKKSFLFPIRYMA